MNALFPVIMFGLLVVSYIYYHKIQKQKELQKIN
jgi:uncharacterized BrkB/YihY/UPF0761 family membrane protein